MERCWCDEERAPYSTKGEKVSPLTEARSARSEGIASERSNSSGGELSRIGRRNRQVLHRPHFYFKEAGLEWSEGV